LAVTLENTFKLNKTRATRYLLYFENYVEKAQIILDLGCGSGEFGECFAACGSRVISLDLDKNQLRKCEDTYLERICGDGQCIPFREQTFDCILSFSLMEHLQFPRIHAKESYRVLRPNGIGIFQLPNLQYLIEPHTKLPLFSLLPKSVQLMVFRRLNYSYLNMSLTINKGLAILIDEGFTLKLVAKIFHLRIMQILPIAPAYIFVLKKVC
jgi:SAM-dependent methyltransferase